MSNKNEQPANGEGETESLDLSGLSLSSQEMDDISEAERQAKADDIRGNTALKKHLGENLVKVFSIVCFCSFALIFLGFFSDVILISSKVVAPESRLIKNESFTRLLESTIVLAGVLVTSIVLYFFSSKSDAKGLVQILWEILVWKKKSR